MGFNKNDRPSILYEYLNPRSSCYVIESHYQFKKELKLNINATLIGQVFFIILLLIPVFSFICYKVGKKKTTNPKMVGFVGAALSLFPPLNFVFLAVLVLKSDLPIALSES